MEILVMLNAIVFAPLIGFLGIKRKIGFAWAFIISLFLSPLIGLIITLCSKKIEASEVPVNIEEVKLNDEQTESQQSVSFENTMVSGSSINHTNDGGITHIEDNVERD